MSPSVFDFGVQVLECARCSAPLRASVEGGAASCTACGTEQTVAPRASLPAVAPRSPSQEVDRLARLQAQADHPLQGHAYDLAQPALGWSKRDLELRDARERLRTAWSAARAKKPAQGSTEDQRAALWLALKLADAEARAGQPAKGRAALETALVELPDPGHRQLLRCRLAAEALAEGDAESAASWLAGCDPAPDVLEIDSVWREVGARMKAAAKDHAGVLALTGQRAANVPVQAPFRLSLAVRRVHALESLGHLDEARAELREAESELGEATVRAELAKEGLAPQLVEEARRREIDALVQQRAELPTGLASLASPLMFLPAFALVGLVAVTIPRCTVDADPFMGAHGYVLCPYRCKGCTGPYRIYTEWEHNGGEHSTNGADYYCRSPANKVATMSDADLAAQAHQLGAYELSIAPAAATYLTFLLLGLLGLPWFAFRGNQQAADRRKALDASIEALTAKLARPMDIVEPIAPASARLGRPLFVTFGSALLALLVIVAELAFRG